MNIYSFIRELFVKTFSFVIVYLEQYRDICNTKVKSQRLKVKITS